jgi:hypothetical protein
VSQLSYNLTISDREHLISQAETIYDLVWRFDFSAPGFCQLDLGAEVDSHALRSCMVDLKERLSEIGTRKGNGPFGYLSLGRFDQQLTTKFHRDGAPDASLLMLGYEASDVRSRLFLADYSHAAHDLGMSPKQFLKDFNPMYKQGEELLARYITEVSQPQSGHSRIVLINNSTLAFEPGRVNSLGILHQAIIDTPNDAQHRIINSTMLASREADQVQPQLQRLFVTTDKISPKIS